MEIEFHFTTPEQSPGYLLWQVNMLWQRKMNQALSTLNITHTQFVVLAALAWISKSQTLVNQNDIANHIKIDRMMTSKVLLSLERKKLITRKNSDYDGRVKIIALSEDGFKLIQQALLIVETNDLIFFEKIDTKQLNSQFTLLLT